MRCVWSREYCAANVDPHAQHKKLEHSGSIGDGFVDKGKALPIIVDRPFALYRSQSDCEKNIQPSQTIAMPRMTRPIGGDPLLSRNQTSLSSWPVISMQRAKSF